MSEILSTIAADGHTLTAVHTTPTTPETLHVAPRSPELRDRVRAAVLNRGFPWPDDPIGIDVDPVAPGGRHDLAAAVAMLAAARVVAAPSLQGTVFAAELGLDGRLRPLEPADLAATVAAATRDGHHVVITAANSTVLEHSVSQISVYGAGTLADVVDWVSGAETLPLLSPSHAQLSALPGTAVLDAVEVAAAGGHPLGLLGYPASSVWAATHLLRTLLRDPDPAAPDGETLAALTPVAAIELNGPLRYPATLPRVIPGGVMLCLSVDQVREPGQCPLAGTLRHALMPSPDGNWPRVVIEPLPAHLVVTAASCPCGYSECYCSAGEGAEYRDHLASQWPGVQIWTRLVPGSQTVKPADRRSRRERVWQARAAAHARWGALNSAVTSTVLNEHNPNLRVMQKLAEYPAVAVETLFRVAWTFADLAGLPEPGLGQFLAAAALCSPTEHR